MNNQWLDRAASEEMDSAAAKDLIECAVNQTMDALPPETSLTKVLCVGCGDGTELVEWKSKGAIIVNGVDLNEESLKKARSKDFMCYKMDMHNLEMPAEEFDLVFLRDVFEHAVSPIQAISEVARVSSKYVVVVLPDESWQSSKWHYIIPTFKQMVSLAEKVGLKLRALREYNVTVGRGNVSQSLYLFEK